MKINKLTESNDLKKGYSHFEFTSGANPYIAKTKDEVERIKRSRRDSVKYVGNINGIDYYKVDDGEEKDLFRVDDLDEGSIPRNALKIRATDRMNKKSIDLYKHNKYWKDSEGEDYNLYDPSYLRKWHDIEVLETDPNYKPNRTKPEYVVQGNYGYGWEDLTASDNPLEAKADLKAYRENEVGVAHRLITRRVPVTENLKEAFKPSDSGIQSVKCYNRYNYTIQELRVDNDNKTFERGNFTAGKADKKTKNRQEFEDVVDTLKELGYTEIKSDYRSMRNKSRKGIPTQESWKKGDRAKLPNEQTGTVSKDFDWENEDQVSVEIDDTKEMRYPRSETLKDLRESLTEDTAVSSSVEFDDDTDDMTFYYEDEQWEEPGVSPRKDFYEDGKEFTWVKRHGDVEHLDFDNWSVWEAYCHDDAESYYFIVDEDTEFIDWGPVDTLEEAQEFLHSKVSDWENDYEFVDNFADDDLDEGIFDKIKGYGKDLVKGIASQAGTIAKNAAGMAKQAVDNKRGNDLQNSVGGDIFTLAKGAGAEVTTTSDNKSTIIQLPDNMNANDKKALLDTINETGIKYDKNLAAKGMIQIPTSEVKKAQKVINKDKKMQLKADNKQAKAQQDLKNMFSQAGITKLSQLKDLGILSESFGDENAYDVSVYLFPPLTDEDLDMLRAYNLTYLGRNYGPYGDEDNYVVAGNESSLRNYANKYLGYELHPDYLYEYDDFAGEIEVNENLLSEGLQEEPHTIEAGPAVGMAQLLSDLIKDEYEAIDGYNSVIATADAEGYDDMIDVLTDVQAEENVHIGQLQELRKMVDPNAHMVEDGEEEAEEELSNPIM